MEEVYDLIDYTYGTSICEKIDSKHSFNKFWKKILKQLTRKFAGNFLLMLRAFGL